MIMVFGRIADIIASATTLFSTTSSSNAPHAPGLPPLPVSQHISSFGTSRANNILRPTSSLQDFSKYRQLDPVEGDINLELLTNENFVKKPLLHIENTGSSFSKDKSSPRIPKQKKWKCVILILLCLVLVAGLVFALLFIYFGWSKQMEKYYVVLDCGSTGSRVFVYQASANHQKDSSLPVIIKSLPESPKNKFPSKSGRAYNRMETEPGFDKLVHDISGLRGAIKPLVQWAKKQIPRNAHKSTSLFLYATAGLRRLPSADSEWVLNNAWSILKKSPFLCKREWIKIISGMEEAYFGWIALNYHSGTLGTFPNSKTVGALDLGGSSLQVTFESKTKIFDETSLQLSIGPVNHHLSAYSLSGYGLNDAFDKSVVYLLKKLPQITDDTLSSGKVEVKHPCLQSGYNEQYMCSQCASTLQKGIIPSAEGNKLRKGGKPGVTIQLTGAPKWEECRELARVVVNLSEWSSSQSPGMDCELQPCALASHLPRPRGNFYAISGFYVVYRFFNLTPEASLDDVLEKGQEFCEKSWDIAKKSVVPQPSIEQYCFRAPYVIFLLREGLHITDSNVAIGSGSITWTLGVALLEAGKTVPTRMVFSYEKLKMKINPVILFGFLFLSLFVLLCALFCFGNVAPKYFRRTYLPFFRHNNPSSTSVLNIPDPFRFQRWSPISPGDGRVKLPLSPTVPNTKPNTFDHLGIQLTESPLYRASSVSHSLSSDSLGNIQSENSSTGSFWGGHRSNMRLQSRRSQSREDLHFEFL